MIRNIIVLLQMAVVVLALTPLNAHGQPAPTLDPASVTVSERESRAVVVALAENLRERFAFPERGVAAAEQILVMEQRGVFRQAKNASELLDLIETHVTPIVNDQHFRARYFGPEIVAGFSEAPRSAEDIAAFHDEVRLRGGEVPEARWLPGNVGYLRISMFLDADPSREKLAAAMDMLSDTAALIIDVRDSPGGEPTGVANVIGHLVSERTATVHTQDPGTPPTKRTFYAEPRTPSFAGKPVFVLINNKTGSGAEEFAYDLQAMQRATLVGETSSGAATPGGYRPLAHGFVAFIPMQVVANAVTGTNWEGIGVIPDVKVPAAEALTHAHRLALKTMLERAEGLQREIAEEGLAEIEGSTGP